MSYRKIKKAEERLHKLLGGSVEDPGCNFVNGDGYYQLSAEQVRQFDFAFVEAVKEFVPDLFNYFVVDNKPFNIKSYYVGRYLDDNGSILYKSLMLRYTIDDKFRRWGQPYYAINPGTGKDNNLGSL